MTCHECRDELELWVGTAELPTELRNHLEDCADCRKLWDELSRLAETVADDRAFDTTPEERAAILKVINRRTQNKQATPVTPMNWLRVAAVAASVIIVAGIGITGYRAQWFGERASVTDTTVVAQADTQSERALTTDIGIGLEDEDNSIFEQAIDSTVSFDDAAIFDSLSDEQIQYLESNLDVRGLI